MNLKERTYTMPKNNAVKVFLSDNAMSDLSELKTFFSTRYHHRPDCSSAVVASALAALKDRHANDLAASA